MAYAALILTTAADLEQVRAYIGVSVGITAKELPDVRIIGPAFLYDVELDIAAELERQGLPTVATLMNVALTGAVADANRERLKKAAIAGIAAQYAVGITQAVDTSTQTNLGENSLTEDLGGIGAQWQEMRRIAEADYQKALRHISGWERWGKLV